MGKRAAIATDADSAKKARVLVEDPVLKKSCKEVCAALHMMDDLPAGVVSMLEDIIPLSLGELKEDRHQFQSEAVAYIDKELKRFEADLQSAVDEAATYSESVASQKAIKDAEIVELQAALAKTEDVSQERKRDLAQVASMFQQAKTALQEAELNQETSNKVFVALAKQRAALAEALTGTLQPLKDGTGERSEEIARALVGRLEKLMDLDKSLATSIPLVLAKAAHDRGTFDNLAAEKLEADVQKALSDLDVQIADSEPSKQRLAAAIEAAKQALEEAKTRQIESAKEFMIAKQAAEQACEKLQMAQGESKNLQRTIGKAKKAHTTVEFRLSAFRDGALATFTELRDRKAPAAPAVGTEAAEAAASSCGAETAAATPTQLAPVVQEVF